MIFTMSCLTMKSQSMESHRFSSLTSGGSSSEVTEAALPSSGIDNGGASESQDCFDDCAISAVTVDLPRSNDEDLQGYCSIDQIEGGENENTLAARPNDQTEELSTGDKDGFVFVSLVAADALSCEVMADSTAACTERNTINSELHENRSPSLVSDNIKNGGQSSSPLLQDRLCSPFQDTRTKNLVTSVANTQEITISRLGRESVTFESSDKDHDTHCLEGESSTEFVIINTSADEWNVVDLQEESETAKTCPVANDFTIEHYHFALNKKVHEGELPNTNECNKRTNRRRRRNVCRTKNIRKWRANSLCEDVVDNFDFSLFPYRAEHMTTDAEELAYMNEQLAKIEQSASLNSYETTVELVVDSSRTSVDDCGKSQTDSELEVRHKLKIISEPTLYFSDARYDLRTTYEDRLCPRHTSRSLTLDGLFDLQDRGAVVRLRGKKKWRIEKARVQVKTKHCQSVCNTAHGRTYYVHHRVTKLMPMSRERLPYSSAAQLSTRRIDKVKGASSIEALRENMKQCTKNTPPPAVKPQRVVRPPPVAPAPRYAINQNNADTALSADLINILITMQDRDLSPEDYELLLRLDERVAPKTIDVSRLDKLRTDIVGEERVDLDNFPNEDVCTVCMDMYEVGQVRKYLPCGHGFHAACIDGWLMNASVNCPLDGQEVRL